MHSPEEVCLFTLFMCGLSLLFGVNLGANGIIPWYKDYRLIYFHPELNQQREERVSGFNSRHARLKAVLRLRSSFMDKPFTTGGLYRVH